ncbi:MAG TPA: Smr/MutS family protein [Cytophagaceae bacterium]
MENIKPGDFVKLNGQEAIAEVLAIKGNDLEIAMGQMKMTVKKNKVTLAEPPEEEEYEEESIGFSGVDTKEKLLHFKFELDVRGKMKDEVITELSNWVDDAILLGVKEASIFHGRGTGVLKDTVRSFLRKYKEVESVADAPKDRGGDNMTIVKFKEK